MRAAVWAATLWCAPLSALAAPQGDPLDALCYTAESATLHRTFEALRSQANDAERGSDYRRAVRALLPELRGVVERACRGQSASVAAIHVDPDPGGICRLTLGRRGEASGGPGDAPIVCVLAPAYAPPTAVGYALAGGGCRVEVRAGKWRVDPTGELLDAPAAVLTVKPPAMLALTDEARWIDLGHDVTEGIEFSPVFDMLDESCQVNGPAPARSDAQVTVTLSDAEAAALRAAASDVEAAINAFNAGGRAAVRARLAEANARWSRLARFGYPENVLESLVAGWRRERRLSSAHGCDRVGQEYACDAALDPAQTRIVLLHPSLGVQVADWGEQDGGDPAQVRLAVTLEGLGFNYYVRSFRWYFGLGAGLQLTSDAFGDPRPALSARLAPFVDAIVAYSFESQGLTLTLGTELSRFLASREPARPRSTLRGD